MRFASYRVQDLLSLACARWGRPRWHIQHLHRGLKQHLSNLCAWFPISGSPPSLEKEASNKIEAGVDSERRRALEWNVEQAKDGRAGDAWGHRCLPRGREGERGSQAGSCMAAAGAEQPSSVWSCRTKGVGKTHYGSYYRGRCRDLCSLRWSPQVEARRTGRCCWHCHLPLPLLHATLALRNNHPFVPGFVLLGSRKKYSVYKYKKKTPALLFKKQSRHQYLHRVYLQ